MTNQRRGPITARAELLGAQLVEAERSQARNREPFFRVFSELDRWIRLELVRQSTGLSKAETAAIFIAKDLARLSKSVEDIGISLIRLEAIRAAELDRSYGFVSKVKP